MKTTKIPMNPSFEDTGVGNGHPPVRSGEAPRPPRAEMEPKIEKSDPFLHATVLRKAAGFALSFWLRPRRGQLQSDAKSSQLKERLWQPALAGLLILISDGVSFRVSAQLFDSGSNGSMGPLNATNNPTILQVPPDGVFHFTWVSISSGVTVRFLPNARNTPVYLLAAEYVGISSGAIDVSGNAGGAGLGGIAGPGGFNGGQPAGNGLPPGDGFGPGGGKAGTDCAGEGCAGGGSYGAAGSGTSTNKGDTYGSPLLLPIVGGSGGGGSPVAGGGGGGGAIVIAANQYISLHRCSVFAYGGGNSGNSYNGGSGGAIRLVTPKIYADFAGLYVSGKGVGGPGRVRIDTWDFNTLDVDPPSSASYGKVMFVLPPVQSRLNILSAAGQSIPEGTNAPVTVFLPFGSDTNQVIRVQARDFAGVVPINVVVTPQNGPRQIFPAEINMATGNPAVANVSVIIPLNTEAAIHAWTR